jgi:hypothetical protein
LFVHTMLGLQPVAPLRLLVVSPALPHWLPELILKNVRLRDATATIRFWRDESGASHAEVLQHQGTFRLLHQPPPESLTASVGRRVRTLFDSIRP